MSGDLGEVPSQAVCPALVSPMMGGCILKGQDPHTFRIRPEWTSGGIERISSAHVQKVAVRIDLGERGSGMTYTVGAPLPRQANINEPLL